MPAYVTADGFTVNYTSNQIEVPKTGNPTTVLIQTLLDSIREAEESPVGIQYDQIATASGKESLGGGVAVGLTVNLISPWQVKFEENGNYIAELRGGNLVGGLSGNPTAYTNGVQVLLVQSAASTIVTTGGSALTTEEHNWLNAVQAGSRTIDGTISLAQLESLMLSILAGKASGFVAGSGGTGLFKAQDGTTTRVTVTYDANGNRTAVTLNP